MKGIIEDPIRKNSLALSYIGLGFNDYLAARVLINKGLYIQGATMASTAIEKYLKAALAYNGKLVKGHLDKPKEIIATLGSSYFDLTVFLDPVFMHTIENAYKVRYHDDNQEVVYFGFFANQFLGELDHFINFFENKVIENKEEGKIITEYSLAVSSNDQNLFENNYILNGVDKETFMSAPDIGFGCCVLPVTEGPNVVKCLMEERKDIYNGTLSNFMNVLLEERIIPEFHGIDEKIVNTNERAS